MANIVQKTAHVKHKGEKLRELIGARLKEERQRLEINQADFAELGGASKRTQIAWEQGTASPNAEFLAAVAGAGVDVQYVVTGVRSTSLLSNDENEVLVGYRSLDLRGKSGVHALISGMKADGPKTTFRGDVGQVVHGGQHNNNIKFTVGGGNKKKS